MCEDGTTASAKEWWRRIFYVMEDSIGLEVFCILRLSELVIQEIKMPGRSMILYQLQSSFEQSTAGGEGRSFGTES